MSQALKRRRARRTRYFKSKLTTINILDAMPNIDTDRTYARAFREFVSRTSQKDSAACEIIRFLNEDHTPRNVFLDIGAGEGTLTRLVSNGFRKKHLVEPNNILASIASARIPDAHLHVQKVEEWLPQPLECDVIILSHVLYHIDFAKWPTLFSHCSKACRHGGLVFVLAQSPTSDYMKLLSKHYGIAPTFLENLHEMIVAAGFEILEQRKLSATILPRTAGELVRISSFLLGSFLGWSSPGQDRLIDQINAVTGSRAMLPTSVDCSQDLLVLKARSYV